MFEAIVARHEHREVRDLYHSALKVCVGADSYTVEMAPVWTEDAVDRGVVCGGAVGAGWLGGLRMFQYEVRRWRGGVIPDVAEAVGSPVQLSHDIERARTLLELVPLFPPATWGRDELRAGEMWNSNSLTAWLLARSGHEMEKVAPPAGGRAPGWAAGVVIAARQEELLLQPT